MKQTYADICLERANEATSGPWEKKERAFGYDVEYEPGYFLAQNLDNEDAEFIAKARSDVPELASRLKTACEALRKAEAFLADVGWSAGTLSGIADRLESMPEDEKEGGK